MMAPVRLFHVEDGPPDGPVLVLADSLGSTLDVWDGQVPALAARHRVVRFDLRGHGRSPAFPGPVEIADLGRDILALLDELDVAQADLLGMSIGGMGAMWAAAHAPDRIRRLMLCSTSARLGPSEGWAARAALVRESGMAAVADAVAARWVTPGYAAAHPERIAELRAMIGATDAGTYAAWCEAIARMDLRPELGRIEAPTLVIAGGEDPAIPMDDIADLGAGIGLARIAIVAGGAHLPNLERGDVIERLILDHLEGSGGERP